MFLSVSDHRKWGPYRDYIILFVSYGACVCLLHTIPLSESDPGCNIEMKLRPFQCNEGGNRNRD